MLPIDACVVEASSCQFAPEVIKGLQFKHIYTSGVTRLRSGDSQLAQLDRLKVDCTANVLNKETVKAQTRL